MRRTATVIAAGALLLLTGCNGDDAKSSSSSDGTSAAAAPATVTVSPADGSADVSPVEPLEIAVKDGDLADVTVVDGHCGHPAHLLLTAVGSYVASLAS